MFITPATKGFISRTIPNNRCAAFARTPARRCGGEIQPPARLCAFLIQAKRFHSFQLPANEHRLSDSDFQNTNYENKIDYHQCRDRASADYCLHSTAAESSASSGAARSTGRSTCRHTARAPRENAESAGHVS